MEHLLALSIDNLSSPQPAKIRKGLRQIEGLLAQICLSASKQPHPSPSKRQPSASALDETQPSPLDQLTSDPAFLEFFRLQQTFEYNLATRLLSSLFLLIASQHQAPSQDRHQTDLITTTLTLLHGILLLHPPSRSLFSRHTNLTLLLDLLQPTHAPSILSTTLLTLLTILLDNPTNARAFEEADGLRAVVTLRDHEHENVQFAAQDVLAYWLMPETPEIVRRPELSAPSPERKRTDARAAERPQTESRTTSYTSDAAAGGGVALPLTPSRRRETSTIPHDPATAHQTPTKTPSRSSTAQTPLSHIQHQRSPSKLVGTSKTNRSDGSSKSWGSLRSESDVVKSVEEKKGMLRSVMTEVAERAVLGEMF